MASSIYADIGHFGKMPIRLGWCSLVLPSLLANYFGQGVGGQVLLPTQQIGLSWWRARLFSLMARNQARQTQFFNLPLAQVFETGSQVAV